MASRTRRLFVVAAALLLSACQPDRVISGWLTPPTNQAASARPEALSAPPRSVSGWVPYWGTTASRSAITNRPSSIGDVTPLFYGTNNDGTLKLLGPQAQLDETIRVTRSDPGLVLFAGIFDSTGGGVMSGLLGDPTTRTFHVQQILDLAVSKGYDGIDLDYEVFAFDHPNEPWTLITPKWVAFVKELSAALRTNNKLLSVTVPPVWNDGNSGYTVYAQDQIAPFIDRLRLMVYDWSITNPGPIAPMNWVTNVMTYSEKFVPVAKLQLGVPTYGRHWITKKVTSETCPDGALSRNSVLMKNIPTVTAGQTGVRDGSGELKFEWTSTVSGPRTKPLTPPVVPPSSIIIAEVNAAAAGSPLVPALRLSTPSPFVTCTVQHTVYVPDAYSVDQRSDEAQRRGWRGIVMWAFGYESSDLFDVLAS